MGLGTDRIAPGIRILVIELENQPLLFFSFFVHAGKSVSTLELFAL